MFIMQITHLRLSPIAAEELSKSKYDEVQRWLKSWTCLNNYEAVVGETYDEALFNLKQQVKHYDQTVRSYHFEFKHSAVEVKDNKFWSQALLSGVSSWKTTID